MDWEWVVDIFTFIGVFVSIIIALIAIVWVTCFFVKLLVKTFGMRVGKSYDLMVEDITKKAEAKKQRNEIKRKASLDKKMEILNMKLESKAKIHEMKKAKLEGKLDAKENTVKVKLFDEADVPKVQKTQKIEKIEQKPANSYEEEHDVSMQDAVDGEVHTIDVIREEELPAKQQKNKNKK